MDIFGNSAGNRNVLVSILLVLVLNACASYGYRGIPGAPDGGGIPSPDGGLRAHVMIFTSDRYKANECSESVVVLSISVPKQQSVVEQKVNVHGCYIQGAVRWKDVSTAEFELFDYGSPPRPPQNGVVLPIELRRTLLVRTLTAVR